MKNSKNIQTVSNNVENKETKKLGADLLSKIGAIVTSANIQQKAQLNNTIYKKGFNNPQDRSKSRKKLFSLSKKILVSAKNNDIETVLSLLESLENHCTTYFVAETKFDKIENYYTSQRGDETTKENIEILKTVFEIANNLKD